MKTQCPDDPESPVSLPTPPEVPASPGEAALVDDRPPMVWRRFLATVGVSVQTGWRWRQLGFIKTHDLAGKPYVSAAEIERFNRRLAAGELSGIRRTGSVRAAGKRGTAA